MRIFVSAFLLISLLADPAACFVTLVGVRPANARQSALQLRALFPGAAADKTTVFQRQIALPEPAPSRNQLQGKSRIFLDTADRKEWDELLPLGLFYGVTTNPVLLERADQPCTIDGLRDLAISAFGWGMQEFMCQSWGENVADLVRNGEQLASIDPRVIVKVPLTGNGIQAANILSRQGARICTTACYAPHQVVSSVAVGAEYVAPYLGRLIDEGRDGLEEVSQMQQIVDGMNSETRVLVASVRTANQVAVLAADGCSTFTISPKVARELIGDDLTTKAAADFEAAAARMQNGSQRTIGFEM
mmetsp:Transcript_23905/g.37424  ORF Transcript_23905/g.37424 Transcript_23905/m.37424 type:complete len:303 (-) Transcript_23905:146-1054(-)|eukprot:CAMPEP_0184298534 /NCGR_PEP_ID=MMETSP1049-20130417/9320_1 /TAXON_ID=77928 /ORGANISM="Proteomonas sulcata, Strain CCMP704" /LENGTH=302 /DNA_ID=CAMNT_0026608693 /DNA_START=311 /DNA_END=1219 /DNA_ORIENTATION=+